MAAVVITREIEAVAQHLADATGTTPTEAVVEALRQKAATLPRQRAPETHEEREKRLRTADEIIARLQALPWDKTLTADEIVGYDEHGLPI